MWTLVILNLLKFKSYIIFDTLFLQHSFYKVDILLLLLILIDLCIYELPLSKLYSSLSKITFLYQGIISKNHLIKKQVNNSKFYQLVGKFSGP
jgi:hypothetical protein